jgi:stage II sporulation protein D
MRAPTPRVVLAMLSCVALLAIAVPGPASALRASDAWVASAPTLEVTGHGFGHGHGMSQYGAQGAALHGRTYRQILAFYYPSTAVTTMTAMVRVLITADTDNNTIVLPTRGLRLIDRGSAKSYTLPTTAQPKAWRLALVQGKTRVSYLTDTWHGYRPGGVVALVGNGEFRSSTGLVTLRTPAGTRTYRGGLRFANTDTVNVLNLENYLKGVIPAEMPTSWAAEALRSQAVAARTYAAWSRAQNVSRYYQICDTTSCQVYRGYSGEQASSNAAVVATAGQILTSGGKPAFTQFSSSSGGWTAAGGPSYLPAQADPYDDTPANKLHDWTKSVDTAALVKAYPQLQTLRGIRILTRDGAGEWGGRVQTMLLDGTQSDVTISGSRFRTLAGLRSTYFTLTP